MSVKEEKGIQELERTKSGEEIVQDIKVRLADLATEIKDAQYLIDTSTGVDLEVAQVNMVKL